jgi:subtilisin family serine protease
MKRSVKVITGFLIAFFWLISSCSLQDGGSKLNTDSVQNDCLIGEIIVEVSSSTHASSVDAIISGTRIKTIAVLDQRTYLLYKLNDGVDVDTAIVSIISSGLVINAEKNSVYSLFAYKPDDPLYDFYQYAPRIAHCEESWDIERNASGVIVAVIDTGINGEHEDLEGRVIAGKNIITGEDILANSNSDDIGHGTHVAGIIGARGDNGTGIAGVAWDVSLMPVKVFAPDAFTSSAFISEGIIYAVNNGAKVINMSFGGGVYSIIVNDAINYAHENNVVAVVSMGNDAKIKLNYPAVLPGVISVGCTNGRDEVSFFSTRGNHISVAAPGESIYSLSNWSNTEYLYMSGTSMAAPFVSGLAALLVSHNTGITPDEVRSIIEASADPLGAEAFSTSYGYGRVNVEAALNTARIDNYGSINVHVTNKSEPVGGIKVILENAADSTVVQAGLTSCGSASGGTNGEIVFNHVRLGDYRVRMQVGTAQSQNVTVSDTGNPEEVSFAFDTPMILLVNGIKKVDNAFITDETLYTRKLTNMGKYFSIWKVAYNGPPPLNLVNAYDLIIWFTGRTQDDSGANIEVLSVQEREAIAAFLDSGKPMYICGNNIAEHLGQADPEFLSDYLHASLVDTSFKFEDLYGLGFFEGMEIAINLDDDDQIAPGPGAVAILDLTDDIGTFAGLSWDVGYRLVFTTITPNQIVYCYPDTFFEDVIEWLELD